MLCYIDVVILSIIEAATAKPETASSAYIDARSYIMLEILLAQPLVPKRPALVIAEK